MKRPKRYRQDFGNRVPAAERALAAILILVTLVSAYSILAEGKARFVGRVGWLHRLLDNVSPEVVVLSDWPIFWLFLLLVVLALTALTYIVDHYDRRWNARFYIYLRRGMLTASAVLFVTFLVSACEQIGG